MWPTITRRRFGRSRAGFKETPPRLLNQLANRLSSRFEELKAATDLGELITIPRVVLYLHPLRHRDFVMSIDKLLLLVRKRVQRCGMAVELDGCTLLGSSANPGILTVLHIFMTILLTISRFRTLENIDHSGGTS